MSRFDILTTFDFSESGVNPCDWSPLTVSSKYEEGFICRTHGLVARTANHPCLIRRGFLYRTENKTKNKFQDKVEKGG